MQKKLYKVRGSENMALLNLRVKGEILQNTFEKKIVGLYLQRLWCMRIKPHPCTMRIHIFQLKKFLLCVEYFTQSVKN